MRWLLLLERLFPQCSGCAASCFAAIICCTACSRIFFINTLMTVICFGRCDRRQFFENWVAVYLVVLLLGGAFEWLQESGILSKSRGVAIAAAVTVTCGLLRYLGRRRAFGSHVRRAWLEKMRAGWR